MEHRGVSLMNYLESLRMRYTKVMENGADAEELEYLHRYIEDVEEYLQKERKTFVPKDFETFSDFCGCFDNCYDCPLLCEKLLNGKPCKTTWEEKRGKVKLL